MTTFLPTTDLCDRHLDDASGDFRVLPPVFSDFGQSRRFHGPVFTVQCYEDNTSVKAALESPGWIEGPEGRRAQVLVVAGGASLRRALMGGKLGAHAVRNGWAGVVVDGAVRDRGELAQCAVGIRALALVPMPTLRRMAGQIQVAVQIQGVWVRPGDWLYADEDGMVLSARPL
jgi:regulator of ribonuclease activity A